MNLTLLTMSNPPNVTHLWIPCINETQLSILMQHFHIIHKPYPANDVFIDLNFDIDISEPQYLLGNLTIPGLTLEHS